MLGEIKKGLETSQVVLLCGCEQVSWGQVVTETAG